MAKTHPTIEKNQQTLAEPTVAYGRTSGYTVPVPGSSTCEKVLASTMSVDEYFDELIEQVHHDYANL